MIRRDRARRRPSLALQEETPEVEGLALRVSVYARYGTLDRVLEGSIEVDLGLRAENIRKGGRNGDTG